MASKTNEEVTDLSVCSICFKKYRTPRILPCSHVFCHECISSTIVSTCQSKEAPVGFSCPLCREFVPSSAAENSPEKWADSLLECKILDTLNNQETNLCAACLRENEEELTTDVCITCEELICGNCAKYHKRSKSSRNHIVCTMTDPNLSKMFLNLSCKTENCPAHPDKEIELQCNDHKIVCCSLCASTEHRECADVRTVQSCVQKIKKEGSVQKLKQRIIEFEQTVSIVRKKQEDNIAALDVASDSITEETNQIRKEINEHLDKLEKEHLDEIGQMTKNSKMILNKSIDSLSDRIEFSKHCIKNLEDIEGKADSCFLKKYQETSDRFQVLERQTLKLKEHEIKLESNLSPELSSVANLSKLSSNRMVHIKKRFVEGKSDNDDLVGMKTSSEIKSSMYERYVRDLAKVNK